MDDLACFAPREANPAGEKACEEAGDDIVDMMPPKAEAVVDPIDKPFEHKVRYKKKRSRWE
jgi:hypothetical protein